MPTGDFPPEPDWRALYRIRNQEATAYFGLVDRMHAELAALRQQLAEVTADRDNLRRILNDLGE